MNHLAGCLVELLVLHSESRSVDCLVTGSGLDSDGSLASGLAGCSGQLMVSRLGCCSVGCWANLMGSMLAKHSGTHLDALSGLRLGAGWADD